MHNHSLLKVAVYGKLLKPPWEGIEVGEVVVAYRSGIVFVVLGNFHID